jgi:hypothetical protein
MDYETGIEPDSVYNGHPSAYLKNIHPVADGFGTLMQDIRAQTTTPASEFASAPS